MKYTPLYASELNNETDKSLTVRYKAGHTIGSVTVSEGYLFIKKWLRRYYISYEAAQKIFRRVRRLHANICCGDGDIEVDYLVVMADDNELIEVTLPGRKAAKQLMDEIRQAAPSLDTAAPIRVDADDEGEAV